MEELRKQNAELKDQLEQRDQQIEKIATKLIDIADEKLKAGVYPLICGAGLVPCRWVAWLYVENSGTTATWEGIGLSVVLGIAMIAVLAKWVEVAWKAIGWLLIPKCAVVLVAMLVAASVFSNGKIWDGVVATPDGHPTGAVLMVVAAFVFVASPGIERGIRAFVAFMEHPLDALSERKEN